jgi:hypothetical protein
MAAARNEEQTPEGIEERFGPAGFADEALALGTEDLPLGGTLVTVVEERGEIGC